MNATTLLLLRALRPFTSFRLARRISIAATIRGLLAVLAGIMQLVVPLVAHGQQAPIPSGSVVAENYGKLPLSFEANQGQSDPQVKFQSRGSGYSLFLTDSSAVLALTRQDAVNAKSSEAVANGLKAASLPQAGKTDVVRMMLAGASHSVRVTGVDRLPGKANYFIGNDPSKWLSDVPTYAKVRYTGVYPGIDLVYYGNQQQLEYDFVIAPGANPGPIRLQFAGAKKLKLTADGDLRAAAANGEIAFHKPVIYQILNGQRQTVRGQFSLLAKNTVGFNVAQYDHTKPLVIDPVLVYSTYFGTNLSAGAVAVDSQGNVYVTGWSTAFLSGQNAAASGDLPVTPGVFQSGNHGFGCSIQNCSSGTNAYITKINAAGTALIYSTYLGGTVWDQGTGIAVDGAGNAYVTGVANSTDFPVTAGAFQTTNRAAGLDTTWTYTTANNSTETSPIVVSNGFVTKLNPTGTALVYSTYLGGSGVKYPWVLGCIENGINNCPPYDTAGDYASSIAVDNSGNAYVTGTVNSTDFPVTSGAFQTVNHSSGYRSYTFYIPSNAFVTKINASGTALVFSTYLGGSGYYGPNSTSGYPEAGEGDVGNSIAIDSTGATYVTGSSFSADFPVTTGAFQTVNNAANAFQNAFITKLNPTGTALMYSTYLGGSGNSTANAGDYGTGISVDSLDNAYVTGYASSKNFPTSAGAFQTVNNAAAGNGSNAYIAKLNPTGTGLLYSTYLGGSDNGLVPYPGDYGTGIAVDSSGSAYVTGYAYSTNFPVTVGAFQIVNNAASLKLDNAFVSKLNPAGTALLYSTYLGGSAYRGANESDHGVGIAVDNLGNAYVIGSTSSQNFPVTAGAYETILTQNYTTPFIAKLDMSPGVPVAVVTVTPSSLSIASGQTMSVTVTVNGGAGNPTPTGSLLLITSGGNFSATLSNGSATFGSVGFRGLGSQTLTANYTPDTASVVTYNNATGTSTVAVTGTPTVSVTPNASILTTTEALTVVVAVNGGSGLPAPTGSVVLTSGVYTSSPATLASSGATTGSATVAVPVATLATGADRLTATYTPDSPGSETWSNAVGIGSVTVINLANFPASMEWTWMSGNSSADQTSVYGSLGVAAASNVPGAREAACSWTDSNGNFWLFGGLGYDLTGAVADINDLWEYNPTTLQWTWVAGSGSGNQSGSYGTLGVPSANNVPSARQGSSCWTDKSGNLWLFGGQGVNSIGNQWALNDLWEFNPTNLQWTWMGGSSQGNQTGTYGTLGVASVSNFPGARYSSSSWTDSSGNLWLFGGLGYASSAFIDYLNDLWEFNPTSKEWTWISGNTGPSYGTEGVAAASNVPGARYGASGSVDGNGNLWLFGGEGYAYNQACCGFLNDVWEFSPTSLRWTWMGGSNVGNQAGVYGTLGVASASNIPGGRYSSSSWTDSSGNLWLFGGSSVPPGANPNYFNDLWEFNPTSLKWTWMGGSNSGNQSGVYGTLGVASTSNVPGARYGASNFIDSSGSLWLFGGLGDNLTSGYLNDLWKFNTETRLTPTITVTPSSSSITTAQALPVTVAANGGTGNPTPTGTVTLVGASYTSAATTLSGGSATITIPANSLADGSDALTATYTPDSSSSSTYDNSTGTNSVTVTTPAVTLSPTSLTFAAQTTGSTSVAQTITLTNSGTAALAITSISASGDFAEPQTCDSSVATGATCTISVTFTPTAAGSRTGTLTITDNAGDSPQTVALSGTGTPPAVAAPAVTLSPTSLTFASQTDGSTSVAQTITLTNSGTAALSITSISTSGDFAETQTCGSSVATGATCAISVTFTPTATGNRTGTLTITDNASGSPQTVAMSGTGAASGTGTPVTVSTTSTGLTVSSPGGTSTAPIQLTPAGGFTGTVNLTCSVLYQGQGSATDAPTCSFSPAQASITGSAAVSSTLTVSTTAASGSARLGGNWTSAGRILAAFLFLGLAPRRRWRGMALLALLCIIAASALVGCGGGGSAGGGGTTPPANPGTTVGNYSVTVTATSGTFTASAIIPLSVQ